jgi:hypothetical protein
MGWLAVRRGTWSFAFIKAHLSHRGPRISTPMTGAQLDWLLGYPDRAVAGVAEAMALSKQIAIRSARRQRLPTRQ